MDRVIIANGRVITPWRVLEKGAVVIEGGKIVEVKEGFEPKEGSEATIIDAAGKTVAPGFVDIHVHGGAGNDTMDATPQAIQGMAKFFSSYGVTGFLPTTVTASKEAILAAIENAALCQREQTGGAQVLGVHVEGPYISSSKPGAQPVQFIRPAAPDEHCEFFAWDNIKVITLAPEIPENKELITYAVQQGATVAVGHSAASYDEVLAAVRLGLSHSAHTFNGMGGLYHREPGTVGAVLTCDEITAEVIADDIHIHPAVIRLLVRAKGAERTVLMTDAIRAAGMADGTYDLGGQLVTVKEGVARIATGSLAGSTLTMNRAVRNAMAAADLSLAEALRMASYNPARVIGMEKKKGSLEPGKDADIVLLDDELKVVLTMVGGKVVYEA
jgi:N-acetylglucosamine-6-phosphate deacetylase